MRDIFNLYGYSRRDRIKSTYKTRKFIKFITEQKINVIYPALCLNYKAKSLYKQKLKNLVEIFIKTDIKKIIENKTKKRIYKLKKNIVGIHIAPQFPKNPNIVIENNFKRSIKSLSDELIFKLKKFKSKNQIKNF